MEPHALAALFAWIPGAHHYVNGYEVINNKRNAASPGSWPCHVWVTASSVKYAQRSGCSAMFACTWSCKPQSPDPANCVICLEFKCALQCHQGLKFEARLCYITLESTCWLPGIFVTGDKLRCRKVNISQSVWNSAANIHPSYLLLCTLHGLSAHLFGVVGQQSALSA